MIDSKVDWERRVPTVEGASRSVKSSNGKRSVEESMGKLKDSGSGNSESKREQPRKREEPKLNVVFAENPFEIKVITKS